MGFGQVTAIYNYIYINRFGRSIIFGNNFYFGSIRKYIVLFGSLFNDILIDRVNEAGDAVDTLKVPLSYGPKDRYLVRLQENPDLLRQVNQVLPRMSFEIKSVEYDSSRKLNTIGKNRNLTNASNVLEYQYNPVPYNFNIDLSILARNADDACRIVEQILPFFKPEWTTAINLIPEMGIVMDIPVVLKNIQYEDTYEASFNDRYAIIWELQFVLKGYIFGPISTQGVINTVDINFRVSGDNDTFVGTISNGSNTIFTNADIDAIDVGSRITANVQGLPANTTVTAVNTTSVSLSNIYTGLNSNVTFTTSGNSPIAEYVQITPGLDANGNPTSNASISIPVSEIEANSNYGYIKDWFTNIG